MSTRNGVRPLDGLFRGPPRHHPTLQPVLFIGVLDTGQPYIDPGPTALNALTAERQRRQAVRRLQALGYQVTITPRTDAA